MRSMNRRHFLILAPAVAVAGASLLSLPAGSSGKTLAGDEGESGGSELAEIVEGYLKNFPKERDVHFLCESLALEHDTIADRAFLSEPMILVRIQQDFGDGTYSVCFWLDFV